MPFYFQCARIRIFRALRAFRPGKSRFSTYVLIWLRGVRSDYTESNALLRSRGKVLEPVRIDIAEDQGDIKANDFSDSTRTLLEDIRKLLTTSEYEYITYRYEGYTQKEISQLMRLKRQEIREVSTRALIKTYNFLKGEEDE